MERIGNENLADYRLFYRSWEKSCQSSAAKGDNVVVTARDTKKLEEFEKDFPRTALIVRLDVKIGRAHV